MKSVLGCLIVLLTPVLLSATIITIPIDQPTIQAGIDAAGTGDTVLVKAGTYYENVSLTKAIKLLSEDGPDLTFWRPSVPDDTVISIHNIAAAGTEIAGFTFDGSPTMIAYFADVSSATFRNNYIFGLITANDHNAVWIMGTSQVTVTRCLFANNGGLGVGFSDQSSGSVVNCTFDSNWRNVLDITNGAVDARNNIITNSSGYGFKGSFTSLDYNDVWNNLPNYDVEASPGTNDISVNPLYVSPPTGDYHLTDVSPCINAGDPASQYFDEDGTRNDMGAFPLVDVELPVAASLNFGSEDPAHLVSNQPTLYWTFQDTVGSQSGYHWEVGTDNDWTSAEMYNTGEVFSADTMATYAGLSLSEGIFYYFRIQVYNGTIWGGWRYGTFRLNSLPGVPTPLFPIADIDINVTNVKLITQSSADPDGDNLTYQFQVFDDPALSVLRVDSSGIDASMDSVIIGPLPGFASGAAYWWRSRAFDGLEYSPWSGPDSFNVLGNVVIAVPGNQPTIQAGIDAAGDGDTVVVSPGTYTENLNFDGKTIVVTSTDGAESTVLQPAAPANILVRMTSGEGPGTYFGGFTLQNGQNEHTVFLVGSNGVTIEDCIFRNNNVGLFSNLTMLYAGVSTYVHRCLFYDNGAVNCIAALAPDVRIINNTFHNNHRGIYSDQLSTIALNNIVVNNLEYGIMGSYGELDYNDAWNNGSDNTPGPNGISTDPMFVDVAAADFTLDQLSPCIDAGSPLAEYDDPDGSRNDMGAFPAASVALPYATNLNFGSDEQHHVVSSLPTLYWTFFDTIGTQSGYEFEVGSDTDWTVAEYYDSGEIFGSDTMAQYGGTPLVDGQSYHFRIRIYNGTNWGGWRQSVFTSNSPPSAPTPIRPLDLTAVSVNKVSFVVGNSTDQQGDDLTYDFEIYNDAALTSLYLDSADVVEGLDSTWIGPIAGFTVGNTYWWRARANDGFEPSAWSGPDSFQVAASAAIEVPGDYSTIQAAINAAGNNDSISVAPGTYVENLDFLGKTIIVASSDGPESTILQPAAPQQNTVRISSGEGIGTYFGGFTLEGSVDVHTVYLVGSNGVTIANNVFRYNNVGIFNNLTMVYAGESSYISRNLFFGNGAVNCIAALEPNVRIINNTVYDNHRGIYSSSNSTVALNNIVVNSLEYGIGGVYGELDYNDAWNNGSDNTPGPNGITVDPQFFDVGSLDFTLSPSSPCIDAGDPASMYNDPNGSRNDMGAFPYVLDSLPRAINPNLGAEDVNHVINNVPTFYWTFFSLIGSAGGYQVQVGTDNDWSAAELWDTGEQFGSDTSVAYAGSALSDGGTYYWRVRVYDGSLWGNWKAAVFYLNQQPSAPTALFPASLQTVAVGNTILGISNSSDGDGDSLTYSFEVYSDAGLTTVAFSQSGVPGGVNSTLVGPISGILVGNTYWWRARAYDGFEYSSWSIVESFDVVSALLIYVPSDYATIQAAIDAAGNGDRIIVDSGTYVENIDFKGKSVELTSSQGAMVTFLQPSNPNQNTILMTSGEDYRTAVRGFTLEGSQGVHTMYLVGSDNVTIAGNIFRNNNVGMYSNLTMVYAGVSSIIKYNLFYDNGGVNCIAALQPNVLILNNTVYGNHRGIYSAATGTVALNNIVVNNLEYGIQGDYALRDYNDAWGNGSDNTPGPNGISTDPLFNDVANDDFTLQATSLCIDAGHPGLQYYDDDGTRNDMGAYPYSCCVGIRGNINGDPAERIDVSDLTYLISYMFKDGPEPECLLEANVNNHPDPIDIQDLLYLVTYMFKFGPPPAPCNSAM